MVIPAGLSGQFGMITESVYGTYIAVTRFLEFDNEALEPDVNRIRSRAIGLGRFQSNARTKTVVRSAAGPVLFPFHNKGMGLLLEHMLGDDVVSGASADKTHTVTHTTAALQGLFASVQIGKPSLDGTINPYTYLGGKVANWEIRQALDDILKVMTVWDFKTEDQGQSLATASYAATQEFFDDSELAVTIAGAAVYPKAITIKGENGLATDRRFVGNVKKEPLANGEASITAELDFEFNDTGIYDALIAGTLQTNLVATWTKATVIPTGSAPYSLTITVPSFEYETGYPVVADEGIVQQRVTLKGLDNGSDPIITVVYVTGDSAP